MSEKFNDSRSFVENITAVNASFAKGHHAIEIPTWGFLAIFQTICSIGAIITNGWVLFRFVRVPDLRTAFNVYLISLLSGNLLYALSESVLDIYNRLYKTWNLSAHWCGFYLYGLWAWQAFILQMHVAITVNRIWAMFWPVSYRNGHSRKVSICFCTAIFVYAHVFVIPFVVIDELLYRLPPSLYGCFINSDQQWTYAVVLQFVVYDLAFAVIVGAYPFLWYKNRKFRKTTTADSGDSRKSCSIQGVSKNYFIRKN